MVTNAWVRAAKDDETWFVSLDDLIVHAEQTYDLACKRSNKEARLAGSYWASLSKLRRELDED